MVPYIKIRFVHLLFNFLSTEHTQEVQVEFQSLHYGATQATLNFEFQREGSEKPFLILCLLEADYQGPLAADLRPSAPYKPYKPAHPPKQSDVMPRAEEGVKPDR